MTTAGPLPNFFIAGAPKAGTTALYLYLGQHPEVFMSRFKEPTYFAAADILTGPYCDPAFRQAVRARGGPWADWKATMVPGRRGLIAEWEDYQELFQHVQDKRAVGEASVDYFWLPSAASAIHSTIPEARLVFMLRDPTERLYSEYSWTGWLAPRRGTFRSQFLAAVAQPDPWARLRVQVGHYATNLGRFFELFPRDRIRVCLYDDYRANPGGVLRDVFTFLGVDPDHPIDLSRRHNETTVARFPRLHALRRRLLGSTSLVAWLPPSVQRVLWRLYRRERGAKIMDPADRRLVVDYYRDEILRTAALLDRDLSAWLR